MEGPKQFVFFFFARNGTAVRKKRCLYILQQSIVFHFVYVAFLLLAMPFTSNVQTHTSARARTTKTHRARASSTFFVVLLPLVAFVYIHKYIYRFPLFTCSFGSSFIRLSIHLGFISVNPIPVVRTRLGHTHKHFLRATLSPYSSHSGDV